LISGGANEWRHGGLTGGTDAVAAENFPYGDQENAKVLPKALVINIPNI
jgi:hypothetical protein